MLEENLSRLWASILIDECHRSGVRAFFTSPGMRNAPFLAALARLEGREIFHQSVVDERSAAFMALGYIKATGRPAAVVCTSGTALANYFPAVIEAYHTQQPLVVISADRPFEWVQANANQSIDQKNIYGKYAVDTLSLERLGAQHRVSEVRQLLRWKLERIQTLSPGPFHLNVPFQEPLDWQKAEIPQTLLAEAASSFAMPQTAQMATGTQVTLTPALLEQLSNYERPLVLVGELPMWSSKSNLLEALQKIAGPKYLDVTSGLKFQFALKSNIVPGFDHPEVLEKVRAYAPDVIFHLGGPFVSKFIYNFIKEQKQADYVHLTWSQEMENPALRSCQRVQVTPEWLESSDVLKIAQALKPAGQEFSRQFEAFVSKKRLEIERSPMVFPHLSKCLVENCRPGTLFYLANSTTIRSFDSFASPEQTHAIETVAHRGVSGIEGFVSAAQGMAMALTENDPRPLCLVIGDLSAWHDLNAFLPLLQLRRNLTVVLVNNHCGGIFNLLPAGKEASLNPYLTTPHQVAFAPILQAMGLESSSHQSMDAFKKSFQAAQEKNSVVVLECLVDENENQAIYQKLKTITL